MIQKLTISPHQVSDYTCVTINSQGPLSSFPFLSVDRDSYLVGVEVQSGINFDPVGGRHCIAIGKGCSLAESITFMIDLNHVTPRSARENYPFFQNPLHAAEHHGRDRLSCKMTSGLATERPLWLE